MKKLLVLMLSITFSLSGCGNKEEAPIETVEKFEIEKVISADFITKPDKVDGQLSFYYLSNKETPYLDFNEFLSKFNYLFGDYLKVNREDDQITLTYKYQNSPHIFEDEIIVNFDANTMSYTRLSMALGLGAEVEKPKPVILNLNDYNLTLYLDEEKKLMPASLCGLLLSQFQGGLLLTNNQGLYATFSSDPNFEAIYEQFKQTTNEVGPSLNDAMIKESYEFLALYMDYIYGLKDYAKVDSYLPLLLSYLDHDELNYYESISDFIVNLNDGHSSVITFSNNTIEADKDVLSALESENEYLQKVFKAHENNSCGQLPDEPIQPWRDDVIYMDYRSFNPASDGPFKQVLAESENKTIVFDIRCNGGGRMDTSMRPLLDYMSNEPLSYYASNIAGGFYEETFNDYESKNEYVVLTTAKTFSAANAFSYYFKDNDLGTIIGEQTGGGAAVIGELALPDGTLLYLSRDTLIVSKEGELVEDGVTPHIPLTFTKEMDLKETILDLIDNQIQP